MTPIYSIERRRIDKKSKWCVYKLESAAKDDGSFDSYRMLDKYDDFRVAYGVTREKLDKANKPNAPIRVVYKDHTTYTIETDGDLMLVMLKVLS